MNAELGALDAAPRIACLRGAHSDAPAVAHRDRSKRHAEHELTRGIMLYKKFGLDFTRPEGEEALPALHLLACA